MMFLREINSRQKVVMMFFIIISPFQGFKNIYSLAFSIIMSPF